ncbi:MULTISPECIES: hypothetical protein [Paraburkholderia]|uniref:hypothetical protein n=1 Tax=Paraburkholderia TaxID=1822464 RepID=UPI0022563CDA|nr:MULTISPECIES: hypothetical protein [Paraburkholderia]MCX4165707.1 hypothetical protein [Paraburkholderia megapolitana]MDN7161198.1 hypothetical protein [Paraburkholderia sp. CHISQ3]MDQ6498245.1 hypothetical protein [Paraburkholderia megapolitana]
MTKVQRLTFWACWGGWAMDGMDVQIFAFVIPTLIALWGMTKPLAGLIGTAALATSAVGGVVSLVPAAVGFTSARFGLAPSIGAWAVGSYLFVFIGALFMPETRNKELETSI